MVRHLVAAAKRRDYSESRGQSLLSWTRLEAVPWVASAGLQPLI